ncbi:hypothetical protein TeGR_g12076 [Tetraparma gracilis]|uniref:Uncharacterized protein n=1 Tax=Tetraparma gracilis TaxID=2962635 RepID=A0ABQ6MD18_9STRA|nr:hypothetical protein TeGR_g12076 [Tetraparma gracilis]
MPPPPLELSPASAPARRMSFSENTVLETLRATAAFAKSFKSQLKELLLETGALSVACAVLPVLQLVYIASYYTREGNAMFLVDDPVVVPVIYGPDSAYPNITVVPLGWSYYKEYFVTAHNTLNFDLKFFFWIVFGCQYGSHAVRVMAMFPARTWFRAILPFLIALFVTTFAVTLMMPAYVHAGEHGYWREEDSNVTNFTFLVVTVCMPLMYTTAVTNTHAPLGCLKSCKMYGAMFLFMLYEMFMGLIYVRVVNATFYDPTTPSWMKFVIRSGVHPLIYLASLEVCWWMSKYMHRELGVEKYSTHVMFAASATGLSLMARMMQGSAITVTESIFYEITGTISEIFMADCLLRGETPAHDNVRFAKSVSSRILRAASSPSNKVKPQPSLEDNTPADDNTLKVVVEAREKLNRDAETKEALKQDRQHFCASALVIISIAEGTSIFVSCGFWMIMNAAPGDPGSKSIPLSQSLFNLAIMLFGEVILTDGIVAYMARHSSRYNNDPALEWAEFKKRKRVAIAIAVIATMLSTAYSTTSLDPFCYTATSDDSWNFATCPPPPQNITEMSKVGESFLPLWWKMRNATST